MSRGKSSLGLDENLAGLLCYLFAWITGVVFLVLEKESKFVKFHAIQSIFTFLILTVAGYGIRIISNLPLLGGIISWILSPIFSLIALILWIFLMYKAFKGEMYKLPFAGELAERYSR